MTDGRHVQFDIRHRAGILGHQLYVTADILGTTGQVADDRGLEFYVVYLSFLDFLAGKSETHKKKTNQ